VPVTCPIDAFGLAFMLHLPFFIGSVAANEIVTAIVPLIPTYAPVPLIAVTGSVVTNVNEQVVSFSVVGGVLLSDCALSICCVLKKIVPFFS
jgi:hypothetical protein